MINRLYRFHGHGSLRYLQKNGETVRGQYFSLRYSKNPKRTKYRLAVIVSRKVSKSAVVRNRIRRRLYESVRILYGNFTEVYDMTLIAYDENLATLSPERLQKEVTKALQKATIVSSSSATHGIVDTKD